MYFVLLLKSMRFARKSGRKNRNAADFSAAYDIDVFGHYQIDNSSSTVRNNSLSPLESSDDGV